VLYLAGNTERSNYISALKNVISVTYITGNVLGQWCFYLLKLQWIITGKRQERLIRKYFHTCWVSRSNYGAFYLSAQITFVNELLIMTSFIATITLVANKSLNST